MRRQVAGLIGAALIAGGGSAAGIALTAGPHYRQQWCYQAEALMNQHGGMTQGQYEHRLGNIGAPETDALVMDLIAVDAARAKAAYGSVLDLGANLRAERRALLRAGRGLAAVDAACGVSPSRAARQNI